METNDILDPADDNAIKAFFDAALTPEAHAAHELDCAASAYAAATVTSTDTDDPAIIAAEQEAFWAAEDAYRASHTS